MEEEKKTIRKWTWFLIIIFIIGAIIIIGAGIYLETLQNLLTSWSFYISYLMFIISLIGLFMYKKWGFYLFSLYLIYILVESIINVNISRLIIYVIIYGYLIWYKGFYKNLKYFE